MKAILQYIGFCLIAGLLTTLVATAVAIVLGIV